jgi:hypothetical protein
MYKRGPARLSGDLVATLSLPRLSILQCRKSRALFEQTDKRWLRQRDARCRLRFISHCPAYSRAPKPSGETVKTANHLAVIIAAAVWFAIGAAWYTALRRQWLQGIGKSLEQLAQENAGSPLPYVVAFVSLLAMCYTLHWIIGQTTTPTMATGAMTGLIVGLGTCAAALALNYGFESRSVSLWLINAGYDVVGLVVAGTIIGGWRKKHV